jgi:hypothetical protein
VETSSARRFGEIVRQIPVGAIGVAGPRGVGKSALIRQYAGQASDRVSVLVSAPVQYDAREFMLHLYATLCHAMIDRVGPAPTETRGARWLRPRPVGRLAVLRYLLLFVSIALIAAILAMPVIGPGTSVTSPDRLVARALTPDARLIPAEVTLLIAFAPLLGVLRSLVSPCRRAVRWLVTGDTQQRRTLDPVAEVAELARQRLRQIRFLQTRTTGWSGKLTLPMSADVGFTGSVQRAERALTYPEIVAELQDFIGQIGPVAHGEPSVVVAIDELDKIESVEQAQRFINEIKGVFGVDHAQFLVSVSDDALASFEQGGSAPIRDAFDSAFDEIVRINHLGVEDTVLMCNSRVIGMPPPFVCLAHCIAGGLARDVIRAARSMKGMCASAERTLAEVCAALVEADLCRKAHAFEVAAARLDDTEAVTEFITALRDLHADPVALLAAMPVIAPDCDLSRGHELEGLRQRAATHLYHCATLLAVFTSELTEERLSGVRHGPAIHPGSFDTLALARRELGARPQFAWRMLDEFRTDWGLPKATPRSG